MDIENEGESLFEEHLDLDTINEKLKKGQIFQGKLFIDRTNINEGRIFAKNFDFEI